MEIIFVLFNYNATLTRTDRMSSNEHLSCSPCAPFPLCQFVPVCPAGLLAWLSVVGSTCEQQS
ncbi:hypothetical protein CRX67_22930 [Enterobacteriaceae bacterium A-F18]|nr:hypothetical protein C2U55_06395 [Enterobacteriaceae bacterium ENNIH3]AUV05976.1 hypothetical protein C2U52_06565 [Enterobacteriaceae bacterium ENNIH2]PTA90478.1 hypothetical protein C9415_22195 [Kluyvera sp. Nf5]PWF52631.1 hypothetical protein BHT19_0017565 [[Kluyvera] intestini]QIH65689.1 hypothetical protein CRX67_22930 [Enterobacteriaceae bacterium A-F18]